MTLQYKFLGIPKTFEELVNNAIKTKKEKITILLVQKKGEFELSYIAYITDGKYKMKITKNTANMDPFSEYHSVKSGLMVLQKTYEDAVSLAKKIQKNNIPIYLSDELFDETKANKRIDDTKHDIERMTESNWRTIISDDK